jgi:hypothetical protein
MATRGDIPARSRGAMSEDQLSETRRWQRPQCSELTATLYLLHDVDSTP